MSARGRAAKRDANEKPIVEALRRCGVTCWRISGEGLPDVLTLYRGRYVPFEVKSKAGKKTEAQAEIPWPIVRSLADALAAVGIR